MYAQTGNITFSGTSTVNALCGITNNGTTSIPISNICFLGNTPIKTNKGIIFIKDIDPNIHTIDNEKIITITKTITNEDYLICFEKDSIEKNIPSSKIIMSKNHKIYYKNKLIEAYKFVNKYQNINKFKYNGEILYNILMKNYRTININNLFCETLHPENIIAKLYTNININKEEIFNKLNKCILTNDYSNYKKIIKTIQKERK